MQNAQPHRNPAPNATGAGPAGRVALIVTPRYLPLLGGMERECALLAGELRDRGWRPVVLTEQLGLDLPRREEHDGITIIRLPSAERRTLPVQLRVAAAMAAHALRLRRQTGLAIVRTTTLPALLIGLLKRLRLISYPTFVTAETGGGEDDVLALAARPLFPVSRFLVSGHDALNGLCEANVDHLRQLGFPAPKITFIPNGVDIGAWERTTAPAQVRRFLFLGRVEPAKGVYELLEAFAQIHAEHPETTLTLAGDGPSLDALRAVARERGLEAATHFRGHVAHETLGELFAEIDCLVLPSYSEALPLSVLEAATYHRVIVATDVGDLRALFGDRIRTVAPRDATALAGALRAAVTDAAPTADYGAVIARVAIGSVVDEILQSLLAPEATTARAAAAT